MAGWSDLQSISTGAGPIVFGHGVTATGTILILDPARCVPGSPSASGEVAATIDPQGQGDGWILHPEWYERGQQYMLAGTIRHESVAARDSLMTDTKTKLRSIKNTLGTMNFAGAGGVSVRWNVAVDFPHISGDLKGFVFGVITPNPV